jgi:O-6-methylguanine DNA methyltransferase
MQNDKSKFKNKVYQVVKKIPRGKFLTYKQIAKIIGHPRAWRAVGNVLNKNRDPKIPCHRVIMSDGRLGGYNQGMKKKIYLLKKEGIIIKNGKITSSHYISVKQSLQKQGFRNIKKLQEEADIQPI